MIEKKLLFGETEIRKRVSELAGQIIHDYNDDKPIVCICVLRGAVMFFADLMKEINDEKVLFDFVRVSSYGSDVSSSGKVVMNMGLQDSVEGKHLLIVEDIVDTGYTLRFLFDYFGKKSPLDIKAACLLDKPMMRKTDVRADYAAFTLSHPAFVVGYGLDYGELYRNLNGIYEVDL